MQNQWPPNDKGHLSTLRGPQKPPEAALPLARYWHTWRRFPQIASDCKGSERQRFAALPKTDFLTYWRACCIRVRARFLCFTCKDHPRHGCQTMAHTDKPADPAAACASSISWYTLPHFGRIFDHTPFQAAQRCGAVPFSRFSSMAFTHFSVVGVPQTVLEGFANYVADDHGCQWSVRPDGHRGRFELSFGCELGALKAARVQRGLKAMGATDCPCIAGQTRPRVVLPSL